MLRLISPMLLVLLSGACYAPNTAFVGYTCTPENPICPDGLVCRNKVCVDPSAPVTDMADPMPVCSVGSLSRVGTGDFTISMTLTTTAKVLSTMAFQRTTCDNKNDFWSVTMKPPGVLVEFGQAFVKYTAIDANAIAVNDGRTHAIDVVRRSGRVMVSVDSAVVGNDLVPQSLGTLPVVRSAFGNPCEGTGGAMPLTGKVELKCISAP